MDNDTTPRKKCTKCGNEYPATLEYFFKNQDRLRPSCKQCSSQDNAKRRAIPANREIARLKAREYYRLNKEQCDATIKRAREKNPEKYRQMARKSEKKRKEKNRIRNKEYRRLNPEVSRAAYHRYQARKKSLPHSLTTNEWKSCLAYFNHCCAACGKPKGFWLAIVPDHWIPVSSGGGTEISNIIPLCHAVKDGHNGCNNSKTNKDGLTWLIERFGKRKAKHIYDKIIAYFDSIGRANGSLHRTIQS